MISKNKLKDLTAYRQQRRCDEGAVFVVEGPKLCGEALASGFTIRVVCATAEWLASNAIDAVPECYEVSPTELERISNMKTPNQVWMLLERPKNSAPFTSHLSPLTLALDRIQDPGNFGTMLRTADWYGIRRVVCSPDTVSCYNPKVVQASMGAIFRTHVEYTDLPQWLSTCGMPVFGATLDGEPLTPGAELVSDNHRAVLLIGNEGRGISSDAMAAVTQPVTIWNIGGTAESLNASVAAAILIDRLIG